MRARMMERGGPWLAAVALLALWLAGAAGAAGPKKGQTITVKAFSAKLMSEPRFFAKEVAALARGDQLQLVEVQGSWLRASGRDEDDRPIAGWIHRSSVETRAVQLSSEGGAGGASRKEVELAGRGFTPEVEEAYRKQHAELDFGHVDRIEKVAPSSEQVGEFLVEGGLDRGGGR